MATENITVKDDLKPQSIDVTNQFNSGLTTLLKVLGVTRKQPMMVGSQIKIYKSEVNAADGTVAEGEVIPLSKVTKKLDRTIDLDFKKHRKEITAESIQSSGFSAAVIDTDNELLKMNKKDIKKDLFDIVANGDGATKVTADNFQMALALSLANLAIKFEDMDIQSVAFVNPIDFYSYLGETQIQTQTAFGLQYIHNFLGFNTIILSGSVPQGKVATTAALNLNVAYAPVNGELSQAFDFTTDATGLIGIMHTSKSDNVSYDTVTLSATKIFPEVLDGIIQTDFSKSSGTSQEVKPTDNSEEVKPKANSSKEDIMAYLTKKNISFDENASRDDLFKLVE